MEENIYKSPESNLESPVNIGEKTFKSSKFKKTIIMNFVGGIGLSIICILCIFSVFVSSSTFYSSGVIFFYAFMAFIAFGSAYAIKVSTKSIFQLVMLVFNWFFILLFILCTAGMFIAIYSDQKFKDVFGIILILFALLCLVPQIINIKAFMVLRK